MKVVLQGVWLELFKKTSHYVKNCKQAEVLFALSLALGACGGTSAPSQPAPADGPPSSGGTASEPPSTSPTTTSTNTSAPPTGPAKIVHLPGSSTAVVALFAG